MRAASPRGRDAATVLYCRTVGFPLLIGYSALVTSATWLVLWLRSKLGRGKRGR